MRLAIFGLSVSSSWGNGHATLWRGLIHALAQQGHSVTFFEWNAPWYALHRDCFALPNGELVLYDDWDAVRARAAHVLAEADVGLVTSYCPHALAAVELLLDSRVPLRVFYDLDAPVTLAQLERGQHVSYIGPRGLRDFDLVLSYTGGATLRELSERLGARRVAPLYGSVDPALHAPTAPSARFAADLSYLGTYGSDRQAALERLFLEPARRVPARKFALAGSQYPSDFPWQQNIFYFSHLPPAEHPAYYCSARLNLNLTREAMAARGHCPSGRLFEATACGAAVLSDRWDGLDAFFELGDELLVADCTDDVLAALERSDRELARIGAAARARTLEQHTAAQRAHELVRLLELSPQPARPQAVSSMAPEV